MRINYEGMEIEEDDPHKVAELIKELRGGLVSAPKQERVTVKKDGGYGPRKNRIEGKGTVEEMFTRAMEEYNKGTSLSVAIRNANNGIYDGHYLKPFKRFLKRNGIKPVRRMSVGLRSGRKKQIDYVAKFEEAKKYYIDGTSLSRSLKKAIGWKDSKVMHDFRAYLRSQGIAARKKYKPENVYTPKKEEDGRVRRMRFMSTRSAWLIKNYQYTKEKAMIMAAAEWKNGGKKIVQSSVPEDVKKEVPAPVILDNKDMNSLLLDMLKNVARVHGKITYYMEGDMLGMTERGQWNDLCAKVLENTKVISEYIGVPNKFTCTKLSNMPTVITYG